MSIHGRQVVFVDANVWFSRTLRDWIGLLYLVGDTPPFEVRWTEDVFAEVLYHLRKVHPDWRGSRITGIRDRLAGVFEGGRVDDFAIEEPHRGEDPYDAHVHAAAVASGADVLLTFNVSDFESSEDELPYEVLDPDEFLTLLDDVAPDAVAAAVVANARYWIAREGEADLPGRLKAAGCPEFSGRVRRHLLGGAGAVICDTEPPTG